LYLGQGGRGGATNFKKIINSLESIHKEGLKEKKGAWVFAKKIYEKQFLKLIKEVNDLLASDLGKGFVTSNIEILQEQSIPLKKVKEFFEYISITILKK